MSDGLERLIETETRLAKALVAAEQEAAEVVRRAGAAAAERRSRSGEQLERKAAELAVQVLAERDAELARTAVEAEARCRRFRELPDARVDELAAWVESLLGGAA